MWLFKGICGFTQQGCKYKHEMPMDRMTQQRVGLNTGLPDWWKRNQTVEMICPLKGTDSDVLGNSDRSGREREYSSPSMKTSPLLIRGTTAACASGSSRTSVRQPSFSPQPKHHKSQISRGKDLNRDFRSLELRSSRPPPEHHVTQGQLLFSPRISRSQPVQQPRHSRLEPLPAPSCEFPLLAISLSGFALSQMKSILTYFFLSAPPTSTSSYITNVNTYSPHRQYVPHQNNGSFEGDLRLVSEAPTQSPSCYPYGQPPLQQMQSPTSRSTTALATQAIDNAIRVSRANTELIGVRIPRSSTDREENGGSPETAIRDVAAAKAGRSSPVVKSQKHGALPSGGVVRSHYEGNRYELLGLDLE